MSTEIQGGQAGQNGEVEGDISRDDVVAELSLPEQWEVLNDSGEDGILLGKQRNQERWQSISFDVSHRKGGDKIIGHYRQAPYRRGRVGEDPVETETLDNWAEAVAWAQERL